MAASRGYSTDSHEPLQCIIVTQLLGNLGSIEIEQQAQLTREHGSIQMLGTEVNWQRAPAPAHHAGQRSTLRQKAAGAFSRPPFQVP